ncbi:MAG: 50S ribosomal protein L19 [Candidatus Omnitrophota bacterium]|nr:50S ribosomal protein L19 [Candidatus Omnitrophota bacterium]
MKATDIFDKRTELKKLPVFRVGDTLKIHLRVKEGEKTRIQVFEGVCIRRRGSGVSASFTVLKETHGDVVEKVFPVYSPTVEKVTVSHKGKAHRAKLYSLRKKKYRL